MQTKQRRQRSRRRQAHHAAVGPRARHGVVARVAHHRRPGHARHHRHVVPARIHCRCWPHGCAHSQGPDAVPCWADSDSPLRSAEPALAVLGRDKGMRQRGQMQADIMMRLIPPGGAAGARTVIWQRVRHGRGVPVIQGRVHSLRSPSAGSGSMQDRSRAGMTGRVCTACSPWVRPMVATCRAPRAQLAGKLHALCIYKSPEPFQRAPLPGSSTANRRHETLQHTKELATLGRPAAPHDKGAEAAVGLAHISEHCGTLCYPRARGARARHHFTADCPRSRQAALGRGAPWLTRPAARAAGPAGSRRAGTAAARGARGHG